MGLAPYWQAALHRRVSRHHSYRGERAVSLEPRLLSSSRRRRRHDLGSGFADHWEDFFRRVVRTFGRAREPGAPLTDRERDIAASLQLRLEEVGLHVF